MFTRWGYPDWFSPLVGAAEIAGAIGLLFRKVAFFSAIWLIAVMTGALVTLLTHRGDPLGWGATPSVYILILSAIAAARWADRIGTVSLK